MVAAHKKAFLLGMHFSVTIYADDIFSNSRSKGFSFLLYVEMYRY